ncbi:MAG TPA: GNAT family N-acetyltransferase [Solirubrobacterales bacterium]|nr:GNAT family N-acetyltransferase [Solirubrobacterales bacterium]
MFCEEQGVSEADEFDGLDADATHVVGVEHGSLVGTCRLIFTALRCRLGRLAVDRSRRRSGVGRRLVAAAEEIARANGARELVAHAQVASQGFYEGCRFVAEGETFDEDGIDHVRMRKTIARG